MKLHHLIHALMMLITEHPEAKDFEILIFDEDKDQTKPPSPQVRLEEKEIWL